MSVLAKFKVKPKPIEPRLKMIVFGKAGAGKSHFACSFPNSLYVDTEGLYHYSQFREMAEANNVAMQEIYSIDEIISLVKELLVTKTEYKTLVIDSMSNIFKLECELEAQRLARDAKKRGQADAEGTEFGRNKAKPKRKILFLVNLLTRLDMNVIITCHPKVQYTDGKESGMDQDVSIDIEHALGTKIEMRPTGKRPVKGFVIKSRYKEIPQDELVEMTYQWFSNAMGKSAFEKQSEVIELASKEQIDELMKLVKVLKIEEEVTNKWLSKAKCSAFCEMSKDDLQKCIEYLKSKIEGGEL